MKSLLTLLLLLTSKCLLAGLPVESSVKYYCSLAKYEVSVETFDNFKDASDFCKNHCNASLITSSDLKRDLDEIARDHSDLLEMITLQEEGELIIWSWINDESTPGVMIYSPESSMLNIINGKALLKRGKGQFNIPALCKLSDL